MGRKRVALIKRLSEKMLIGDGRWEWQGFRDYDGYGQAAGENTYEGCKPAHRVVYEMMVGPIPEGLQLDHLCRNRACVKPSHVEPVSGAENIRRGQSPAAKNARKTHCLRGHFYDEVNTYVSPDGRRSCRTCHRERMAAKKREEKARAASA